MNNDQQDQTNPRLPFPHSFNIGTTLQNVFRNINQAFAVTHDSNSGGTSVNSSREDVDDIPPLEHVDYPMATRPDAAVTSASTSALPEQSISLLSTSSESAMPLHTPEQSHRDDDDDSMPELRSVTDSSDESDVEAANTAAIPQPQDSQRVADDHNSERTDDADALPPLEPLTGSRRARVDNDVDDARDRRHPSERIGDRSDDAAPQQPDPQQPGQPPNDDRTGGFFSPLFGFNPFRGGNAPAGEENPNEPTHAHTGEGNTDPSPANNNPSPGHAPRVVPVLGFTFTIPLFGPGLGNRMGAGAPGGQPPGMSGVDAATREELLASFAAFFQEMQALDEGREDPERAKKLVAGLEVVPLGLVKRLERVGGAPGGHAGDENAEGASSGCAICWDTLLDSDGFGVQQSSGDESLPQHEMSSGSDAMDVDSSSSPSSPPEPSGETSPSISSEESKIISLPCAHVFHASCLIPWFTKAKQATCPTCRFNIDPENLTYTPLHRRVPARPPPAQPENASNAPNAAPAQPQAPADVALELPVMGVNATDAAMPPNPQPAPADARPEPAGQAHGPVPLFPHGRVGPALGFAIPLLSFPAIQIPLRPNGGAGGDQGIDIVTIGLDMFIGGPPPGVLGERDGQPHGDEANRDGGANGETGQERTGEANVNPNSNLPPPPAEIHTVLEGLLRMTRNLIIPQGPVPASPADGSQPATGPVPEAARAQPAPANGPFPQFRPNMFRPMRPMPPRPRKTWTLPPAPGPSLRQRVEQREREQGWRCSDTSCGIGPSDEDPCPELTAASTKQVTIHPHLRPDQESDADATVCAHMFHPACLVSAERVAGWGGEDKTEPLVEVSCPVCLAVGSVTREEWETGVSALESR